MKSIIDEEALNQDELDPDAYALAEVIKQLSPLLQESFDLYSDARSKLVEQCLRNRKMSMSSVIIASIEPKDKGPDENEDDSEEEEEEEEGEDNDLLKELGQMIVQMKAQLDQYKDESREHKESTQGTIEQLKTEIQFLRERLSSYKREDSLVESASDQDMGSGSSPKSPPSLASVLSPSRRSQRSGRKVESTKKVTFTPPP